MKLPTKMTVAHSMLFINGMLLVLVADKAIEFAIGSGYGLHPAIAITLTMVLALTSMKTHAFVRDSVDDALFYVPPPKTETESTDADDQHTFNLLADELVEAALNDAAVSTDNTPEHLRANRRFTTPPRVPSAEALRRTQAALLKIAEEQEPDVYKVGDDLPATALHTADTLGWKLRVRKHATTGRRYRVWVDEHGREMAKVPDSLNN